MKKKQIIKLDKDISFEEAMRHLANTKREDVEETMRNADNQDNEPEMECPPNEEEMPLQ